MFKYLLFKAIYDTAQFWIQVFAPLYFCTTCPTFETHDSQIWFVWFYYYAENVFELASGFLEVAATFDCLITVKQMFPQLKTNRACFIFVTMATIYSILFYSFRLFTYDIVEINMKRNATTNNNTFLVTTSRFVLQSSKFSKTVLNKALKFMHTASRDALVMITTLVLNMFLLATLKDAVRLKKRMVASRTSAVTNLMLSSMVVDETVANNSSRQQQQHQQSKTKRTAAERAEVKTRIMVMLVGLNYCMGHWARFAYYIPKPDSAFWDCFYTITLVPYFFAYVNYFFIYLFNNTFFKYTKRMFQCKLRN